MKVLIIGLGSIAKKHINALNKINNQTVIYALRSNKNADQYLNVINIFDFDQSKNLSLDFVIISSPTNFHLADIKRCLALNTPLLIEKPAFDTLEVGDILKKASGITNYIGCNLRFLDCLIFVKELLELNKEKINEVNVYFGSYLPEWRPNTDYKTGYSARKEQGGGVHLDLIHELDYLTWIFGQPEHSGKILRSKSNLEINSVDYANYNLIYEKFVANVILNYYRRDAKREFEIVLDEFTLKVNLNNNEVLKNGVSIFKSEQTIIDTYTDQMKYFLENKSNKMINDLEEAYATLKICLQ
jgi:predicted dehydrogenase